MLTKRRAEELMAEVSELYATVLSIARGVNENDQALTATQRLVLIELGAAGELRPRRLAELLHTTPATITRAVHALEEAGLVVRLPDRDDRRCQIVAPTKRGLRWTTRRGDLVRETLAQIPPSAAPERLIRDLGKLNDALRKVTGDVHPPRARNRVH